MNNDFLRKTNLSSFLHVSDYYSDTNGEKGVFCTLSDIFDPRTVQPVAQSQYRLSYLAHRLDNTNMFFIFVAFCCSVSCGTPCTIRISLVFRSITSTPEDAVDHNPC
jgi:hypothetical protein